jgi:DNA gyrase/topoisomerase IV subunit B
LVLGIWKFAPDLIAQKRVSIILPPLYGAVKNNKFIPLYNRNDIARYQDTGYNIKRFKGLGEMNPSELRQVIRDPIEYVIESPKNDDEISFIEMLVTDTSLKKKICLNNVFGFERLFSLINKETCNV